MDSKFGHTSNAKCDALKRNCLSERVQEYWNRLPFDVKMAPSINSFKNRLENYKSDFLKSTITLPGNFWELSNAVLDCIEGANYAENKSVYNEYLKRNPHAAKKKFININ